MKHPKFRCTDIAYMDKDSMNQVFDYIREGVKKYIPFECKIQLSVEF